MAYNCLAMDIASICMVQACWAIVIWTECFTMKNRHTTDAMLLHVDATTKLSDSNRFDDTA